MKSKISKEKTGYLFIAPYFIAFSIFGLYPIGYTLWLSFHSWDGFTAPVNIAFQNYSHVINDYMFWKSVMNTAIMTIGGGLLQLLFGITLAYILSSKHVKGENIFKQLFYFPHLVTAVSLGVIFSLLFDWQGGSINQLLLSLGLIEDKINFMINSRFAMGIIIFTLWFQYFGYYTIIFSAGIKGIPNDILEAASIDGVTEFTKLTKIVLPLLRPIITYASITIIIGGMQVFDIPYVLGNTTGDPGGRTMSAVNYLYNTTFRNYNYGYGAAVSYVLFMTIIIFSSIYMYLNMKGERDNG